MSREEEVAQRFESLRSVMNERVTRLWAGAEATAIGRGGLALVSRATGMSRTTIRAGKREVAGETRGELANVRRKGAGRPRIEVAQPGIEVALELLVDPVTRGDPESPLRWTSKGTRTLSRELASQGFKASPQKVSKLLTGLGYSMQAASKTLEGDSHPDRNAQFEHIYANVKAFQKRGEPVISVDTKKKELVGEFKNGGREWQPEGAPVLSLTHDFPDMGVGKAIPYGVYDLAANKGWVSVGVDHDTPIFAVNTIRTWWKKMGSQLYGNATEILVTADAGGSNSYRSRVWKVELQRLADELKIAIVVVHFPPGTSKWNKVEHRLFSHITMNWRGRALEDYETVVKLIGGTTTQSGLTVSARLDRRSYKTGITVTDAEMDNLKISRSKFHGEWNYRIQPRLIS
jgi:Rhodopirellula transposase DDE domain